MFLFKFFIIFFLQTLISFLFVFYEITQNKVSEEIMKKKWRLSIIVQKQSVKGVQKYAAILEESTHPC